MKPETAEVVIDDGVVIRVTNWYNVYIQEQKHAMNADATKAALANHTEAGPKPSSGAGAENAELVWSCASLKTIIKNTMVPSSATPPSRTMSIIHIDVEENVTPPGRSYTLWWGKQRQDPACTSGVAHAASCMCVVLSSMLGLSLHLLCSDSQSM